MRITIIRHAQTRGNLASNYVGWLDEPLAPEGVETARRAPGDATVKEVHASALARAAQTAAILYPNAEIRTHPALNEMHFGRFEGRSSRELETDAEYAAWVASNCETACPGGESKDIFSRRCREAFAAIVRKHREAGTGRLHFVVHGGVIMAILSAFAFPERTYFSWRAGYCGGFVIESTPGAERFALVETVASPAAGEPV